MKNVSVYLEGNIFYRYLATSGGTPTFCVCTPTHPTPGHPVDRFSVFSSNYITVFLFLARLSGLIPADVPISIFICSLIFAISPTVRLADEEMPTLRPALCRLRLVLAEVTIFVPS